MDEDQHLQTVQGSVRMIVSHRGKRVNYLSDGTDPSFTLHGDAHFRDPTESVYI